MSQTWQTVLKTKQQIQFGPVTVGGGSVFLKERMVNSMTVRLLVFLYQLQVSA